MDDYSYLISEINDSNAITDGGMNLESSIIKYLHYSLNGSFLLESGLELAINVCHKLLGNH